MKKWISLLLTLTLVFSFVPAVFAAPAEEPLTWKNVYTLSGGVANGRADMQTIGDKNYLFLPSDLSPAAVPLYFELNETGLLFSVRGSKQAVGTVSGAELDLTALCGAQQQEYEITILAKRAAQTAELTLTVVPTNGVASMFLVSDDPIAKGREWVESSPTKSNKATGAMALTAPDGTLVYNDALTQIKGRGNSTWAQPKKPYQIKLKEKTDLLQTGDSTNAAKTWVLLASGELSLLRNNIVYDLSVAMQMQPGIECRLVNLFYDGEYRGVYLLCEKVEINKGRVDITDLESENETANPSVTDFDALTVQRGTTANGATYVYCEGMTAPENVTGGYLLEMDTPARAEAEKCYFITSRGQYVVVKSPEYCSEQEMAYIAAYYQEFEDTVYNKGVHPSNGKTLADYATVESVAQCYIINELTKNPDVYRSSSFLYKDADSDIMTMGPIWDYDLSFGLGYGDSVEACADPEGFFALRSNLGEALYTIPEFRQAVHDIYIGTVAPLLENNLLAAEATGSALSPLSAYKQEVSAAAYANAIVWTTPYSAWSAEVDAIGAYINTRNRWLCETFGAWSAGTAAPLTGFIDVEEGEWYYDEVMAAAEYGIMNGMSNRIFSPNGNTTRAQAAKVLFEMSGDAKPTFANVFPDVKSTDWFAACVVWAQQNKIVGGFEDGTFRPNDSITRQDMVVILYRFLGSPAVTGNRLSEYTDGASVARYAKEAFEWAIENNIVGGYEDHTLRPQNHITRAELAALTVRFYEKFVTE